MTERINCSGQCGICDGSCDLPFKQFKNTDMEIIEITKDNALSAYNKADNAGKELLENLLGKSNLKTHGLSIMSFEDACIVTGASPTVPFPSPSDTDEYATNYLYQMRVIARAINPKGWQPDYKNKEQKKWQPWMEFDPSVSAFRFNYSGYGYTYARAGSGVRLASEELSDHFGKQFETLISNFLLTQQ
jgi:hypothetical protein